MPWHVESCIFIGHLVLLGSMKVYTSGMMVNPVNTVISDE